MRPVTRRRPNRPAATAVTLAFLAATLAMSTAGAQPHGEETVVQAARESAAAGIAAPGIGTEDVRDALSREIARIEAEIAELERLMRWQEDLARIARTDPAEALRQRRPMADCLASALAPLCDDLTGLFRPEEDEEESPAPPGIGEGAP